MVDDEAKPASGVIHAELPGDFPRRQQQRSQRGLIFSRRITHPRDHLARNDEHVMRRLRIDVVDGDARIIFIDDVRRDFAGDDFFKKGHDEIIS